jgi:hypothetical protein
VKLGRLRRSTRDVLKLVHELERKSAGLAHLASLLRKVMGFSFLLVRFYSVPRFASVADRKD